MQNENLMQNIIISLLPSFSLSQAFDDRPMCARFK